MAVRVLPLDRTALDVVEKVGEELCDVLQSKFRCVTTIEGTRITFPEKRFTATLPNGVVVSVWKADLAKFRADAVVNASNERLEHVGGLALALAMGGGPRIQQESHDYIRMHGRLRAGDAVVADAGYLNYKKIIHAVGPRLSSRPSQSDLDEAEIVLGKAVWKILDLVAEHQLQSVAIPAISSGIFCCPLHLCANTIVSAVVKYYKVFTSQAHCPKEILLTNIEEPTVTEMQRACSRLLSPDAHASNSLAASGGSATDALTLRVERVSLTLIKGHIENLQTDVLVNIISPKSGRNTPTISRSFLNKAGEIVQREFKHEYKGSSVTCTSSGYLACKELFHITWIKGAEAQELCESVKKCLKMAVAKNHKSVSILAYLDVHPDMDEAAVKAIMEGAMTYARQSWETLEVNFVVHPKFVKIFQAFEKQMRVYHKRFAQTDASDVTGHRDSKTATPRISLSCDSDEASLEAKYWLTQTLRCSSAVVIICNNFLQHLGMDDGRRLSDMSNRDVSVEEFWEKGHSRVEVRGEKVRVAVAGIKVEALLCKVLKLFVEEEEKELSQLSAKKVDFKKTVVDHKAAKFSKKLMDFNNAGLLVVKMEEVENSALRAVFEMKKKQLNVFTPRGMFQRLPPHFCDLVCHVGFHSECAPPYEPLYGEGIYFTGSLDEAMTVWKEPSQEYLYFVEAEVLTGKSTPGSPGLILPPADVTDPKVRYHSVSGGDDVSVIFSGHQALPKYIFTCERKV